jgi:hypothetical protein
VLAEADVRWSPQLTLWTVEQPLSSSIRSPAPIVIVHGPATLPLLMMSSIERCRSRGAPSYSRHCRRTRRIDARHDVAADPEAAVAGDSVRLPIPPHAADLPLTGVKLVGAVIELAVTVRDVPKGRAARALQCRACPAARGVRAGVGVVRALCGGVAARPSLP